MSEQAVYLTGDAYVSRQTFEWINDDKMVIEVPEKDIPLMEFKPPSNTMPINAIPLYPPEYEAIMEKLDEIRTENFGPKFEDLSKADRNKVEREINKAKENNEYGNEKNMIEDPNMPGVKYQQLGDWIETTITLYDGLTFYELPEEDQLDILDYEQNVRDIRNSSLSEQEKERAIAALNKPECMENMTEEKRYEKGNIEDKLGLSPEEKRAEEPKTPEETSEGSKPIDEGEEENQVPSHGGGDIDGKTEAML